MMFLCSCSYAEGKQESKTENEQVFIIYFNAHSGYTKFAASRSPYRCEPDLFWSMEESPDTIVQHSG